MKYNIIETDTIIVHDVTLYRVVALKDFSIIKKGGVGAWEDIHIRKGEVGGYIQSVDNLSQKGSCWVAGDARILGNAKVYGNAYVGGQALVDGNARIKGDARVGGVCRAGGDARLSGNDTLGYPEITLK